MILSDIDSIKYNKYKEIMSKQCKDDFVNKSFRIDSFWNFLKHIACLKFYFLSISVPKFGKVANIKKN